MDSKKILFDARTLYFYLIVFTLPWTIQANSYLIVGCLALSLIHPVKNLQTNQDIIYISVLLIVSTSLFFLKIDNLIDNIKNVEKYSAYIAIPILFLLNDQIKAKKQLFYKVFSFSVAIALLFLIVTAFTFYINCEYLIKFWLYGYFTTPLGIHPVYLSMYSLFTLIIIIENYSNNKEILSNKYRLLYLFSFFCLSLLVITLGSRIALLSLFLIIIQIPFNNVMKTNRRKFLYFFILITFFALIIYLFIGYRLEDYLLSSIQNRLNIWHSAILIIKDHILFGVGHENIQEFLNIQYLKFGYDRALDNQYNTHNIYLNLLVMSGLTGFLIFALVIIKGLIVSIKRKSFLIFNFLLIILITGLTENILSVQKGIVFFLFFLLLSLIKERK